MNLPKAGVAPASPSQCHAERSEESRSGSPFYPHIRQAAMGAEARERRARFLAALGMTLAPRVGTTSAQRSLEALTDTEEKLKAR